MLATAQHTPLFEEPVTERLHPRVDANFMVKVLSHGRTVLYKARDLSLNGVFLHGHTGRLGHELHLSIPLPEDVEVRLIAKVTRVDDDGVALSFDEPDWEEIFAFARFLHPRLP